MWLSGIKRLNILDGVVFQRNIEHHRDKTKTDSTKSTFSDQNLEEIKKRRVTSGSRFTNAYIKHRSDTTSVQKIDFKVNNRILFYSI